MMQSLRDNMKLIIWITAIVFLVGFGILQLGGVFGNQPTQQRGPTGIVADINGEPIRYDEYMGTVNQMTRQLEQTRPLQAGEDAYIREQAWQTLVRNKLLMQEAKRRHLGATPEEIKMALRVAPPEFLVQADAFKGANGQFDYRKYLAELDNPNSQMPWGQVEALVADQLPIQKLQEQIVAGAKVSEGDVRERFLLQNDKVKFKAIQFLPDSFPVDTSRIGGADVESYYKAHPDEFTGPEEVKVAVVLIPRKPDATDFSTEKERLRAVLDMARAQPDSFPSLARSYSEIQSASRGGDPGSEPFFDEMRPIFRRGLQNLQAGQITDILQEERSLHIFKVEKRWVDPASKREKFKYREIAVRVEPGTNAVRAARELAQKAEKDAKRSGLEAVATRMGTRTFTSEYFAYGQSGNDVLQRFPEVETWMFRSKAGAVSEIVPTENGYFIFQVVDHRPAGLRPLDRMEAEAKAKVVRSLRMQRAKEAAEQARAALAGGAAEPEVAARFHGRVADVPEATRNGYMSTVGGREPRVIGAVFAMQAGAPWSTPLVGDNGVYVAQVEAHMAPSEDDFRKQEGQVRDQLLNERRQLIFVEWMQDLRRKAKIKDYREQYFEV
jgi:parvulin-like peptidyl-prolyl isomerase